MGTRRLTPRRIPVEGTQTSSRRRTPGGRHSASRALRGLLQPKLIAGLLVGAVALAFLLSVTDLKTVGSALASFPPILLPVLFGLVVVREAIRVGEWRYLLSELGLCSLWKHDVLALL